MIPRAPKMSSEMAKIWIEAIDEADRQWRAKSDQTAVASSTDSERHPSPTVQRIEECDDPNVEWDDSELIGQVFAECDYKSEPDLVERLSDLVYALSHVRAGQLTNKVLFANFPETVGGETVIRYILNDSSSLKALARRLRCAPSSLRSAERRFLRFLGW